MRKFSNRIFIKLAVLLVIGIFMLALPAEHLRITSVEQAKTYSQNADRTMIDNERGLFYGKPDGSDWSQIGAYAGAVDDQSAFQAMNPDAIKIALGRFQHFAPEDDTKWSLFPYSKLKAFNEQEVAAGRAPIFITATYEGKKRPVYFQWLMGSSGSGNTASPPDSDWAQAVNVGDDRFIRFWIDEYARKIVLAHHTPNLWIGLDNCAFQYNLYGVFDDNNNFVEPSHWDSPFPQNEEEYLASIKYFFQRVKELAPDIHLTCNMGDLADYTRFPEIYANIDGAVQEDMLYSFGPSAYQRKEFYHIYTNLAWLGSAGKVGLIDFQSLQPGNGLDDRLRAAYIIYQLVRGVNFFHGFQFNVPEVPPAQYRDMGNGLGAPVAPATVIQAGAEGYNLYSREMEGGIIYLNMTGAPVTVDLPAGHTYYDRQGHAITQLSIPDLSGDYAVYTTGQRVAKPAINPRETGTVAGTVTVSIQTVTPDAVIRYTTDGTEPSESSQQYSGPFQVTQTTTVKAKAFHSGYLESFSNSASFIVLP